MFSINMIVFMIGTLLLLGIASSKFSARIGMPVLVLFMGVGMLAGSEGLGRIAFENYQFANSIGSVALALILLLLFFAFKSSSCHFKLFFSMESFATLK